MKSPIPFITSCDGKFVISEQSLSMLSKLDGPTVVIGIAGLYRTGKSFVLNQLQGRQDGFEIGATVRPCTKGLWIWGTPKKVKIESLNQEANVLMIDTEGIGSFSASETYDAQIFSLALLLSSYFIYNSLGNIDDSAISRLGVVTELAKYIRSKDCEILGTSPPLGDIREVSMVFPDFMWLVRDFVLELSDKGKSITAKEYLEMALQDSKANDELSRKNECVKQALKEYFIERDCFTMIRPVIDEKKLQHISTLSTSEIRPEFLKQMETFKSIVFDHMKPKQINGKFITGRMLGVLAQSCCESLNKGGIVIETCWQNVVKTECEAAYLATLKKYSKDMKKAISGIVETSELERYHKEIEAECMKSFLRLSSAVDSSGDEKIIYQIELRRSIFEEFIKFREGLRRTSFLYCEKILSELVGQIDSKLEKGDYDSLEQFEKHLNQVLEKYNHKAKGSEKQIILATFFQKWMIPSIKTVSKKVAENYKSDVESKLKRKKERLEQQVQNWRLECESIKVENTSLHQTISIMEQKKSELEVRLNKYKHEIEQLEQEKNNLISKMQETESDLENKIRKLERDIISKDSQYRSLERTLQREKEKAQETEDRLKRSLQEKEKLLSADRTHYLEKQVEQLNATNRRILEINKAVMEENKTFRLNRTDSPSSVHVLPSQNRGGATIGSLSSPILHNSQILTPLPHPSSSTRSSKKESPMMSGIESKPENSQPNYRREKLQGLATPKVLKTPSPSLQNTTKSLQFELAKRVTAENKDGTTNNVEGVQSQRRLELSLKSEAEESTRSNEKMSNIHSGHHYSTTTTPKNSNADLQYHSKINELNNKQVRNQQVKTPIMIESDKENVIRTNEKQ